MKLNPKIAKTPEDLQDLEFKRMKAMIKRDLKRLEKLTTADKPTQVMIMGEYAYKDKPNGVGLILFGAWKGTWKSYAKNEVAKQNELGAIGAAHFDGIGDDGQKIVTLRLAKGKGKNKHSKLERGLKKLVPQSTYNLVFDEISEEELSTIEQRLDSVPDIDTDETFEDPDLSDEGDVELDNNQDLQKLLDSNLKEISATIGTINAQILPRLQAKAPEEGDGDSIVNLIDLCNEWIELYQEAQDPAIQSANTAGLNKVKEIKGNAEKMLLIGTQQGMTTSKPVVLTEGPDLAKAMTLKGRDLLNTGKYDKKGGQTYCNFFAMDYVDQMIGMELFDRTDWKNSEYLKWVAKNDPNWSLGGCGAMMAFMESRPDAFPPIKTTGPARYEEAWKAANNGKLVLFIDKGHVAVASYTPQLLDYKVGGNNYKIGNVVQAGASLIKGDKTLNYAWTLRNKDGSSTGVLERLKIFIVNKPVQGITGGNNDQNQSDTPVSNDVNSVTAISIRGAVGEGGGNFEDTVVVQRLLKKAGENLGNFGPNKDGIDGDCGNTTIKAIKSFQSKKGLEQNGLVMPGNNTWLALIGQPYTQEIGGNNNQQDNPQNGGTGLKPDNVKFTEKAALPSKAKAILAEIFAKAGEDSPMIVSTLRSAEEQASIMYLNLESAGVKLNRKMYKDKAAAGQVIDAYEAAKNAGKAQPDIIGAMLAALQNVGADKISGHCNASNPAIDVHPSSIKNKAQFEAVLKADPRVAKVVCPPKDTTYHIELK
jgi:hypothetical protein